jgi:uncharacterized membrane protein
MTGQQSLRVAGLLLGLGLGGFADGIVLHQLLEWHHMLSSWHPMVDEHSMRLNMVGDGLFHLFCLVLTVAGVLLLNRSAAQRSTRRLAGWLLSGWGLFNIVEGVVDHILLGVHHVRSGPNQLVYDLTFLVLGGILLAIGLLLARDKTNERQQELPLGSAPIRH